MAFDQTNVSLGRYESHGFDTGLTPVGNPVDGPIFVVNVMARRGAWDIASCEVNSESNLSCAESELLFLYGISGDNSVNLQGKEALFKSTETLIISGTADVNLVSDGKVLISHLKPFA